MEALQSSEMQVNFYNITKHHIPEDNILIDTTIKASNLIWFIWHSNINDYTTVVVLGNYVITYESHTHNHVWYSKRIKYNTDIKS